MKSRYLATVCVAVLSAMAASSAVSPFASHAPRLSTSPGTARLYAVGTRSAAQLGSSVDIKLDSILADLSRHASRARPDHLLLDLHSLSPAAHFSRSAGSGESLVLVDAITLGNPQELKAALVSLGLEHPAVYSNDVGGWLPIGQLQAAAARNEVHAIRSAMSHTASTGPVATQGDYVQGSAAIRAAYPAIMGTGITVGVLSDSFNCYAVYADPANHVPVSGYQGYAANGFTATYATDQSTGALPAGVKVLEEANCLDYGAPDQAPFGDEGRAMLQIVHAIAPGAGLAFYTAENSEAGFANGVTALASSGAKVIADDVGYFDEPYYQDGIVAQAIAAVEAQGVAYFTAAGNNGTLSYENTAPKFTTQSTSGASAGESLLNFDASGATTATALPITVPPIPPGAFFAVVVEWDQPYVTGAPNSGGSKSQIDVCITGGTGSDTITDLDGESVSCSGPSNVGADPYQVLIIGNPANAKSSTQQQNLAIQVGVANDMPPGRLILTVEDDGLGTTINKFATKSATIQGHRNSAEAITVGASFFFYTLGCGDSLQPESYSSAGGAPTLFDAAGTRLGTPNQRQKPDITASDGANDTFLGFTLAADPAFPSTGLLPTTIAGCQNQPSYPNFFGTSAATPHAAGMAALLMQANGSAGPSQIYDALRAGALFPSNIPGLPNYTLGHGEMDKQSMAIPVMSASATAIAAGDSVTVTWSTILATACVDGSDQAQPTSGSMTITPTTTGIVSYQLACNNATETNGVQNSVQFAVGVPPPEPAIAWDAPQGSSAATIGLGDSAPLYWSSSNASACAASGDWSGTPAPSGGSVTIVPTAVGTQTFYLTCSNVNGTSGRVMATLTTRPPVPLAPTLTLGSGSVTVGDSTTITWSSKYATSCAASGSWSGTLAGSGSQKLSPTVTGTSVYTLACSNGSGSSPSSSVSLTVTAVPSSGGGAMNGMSLIALALLGAARRLGPRRDPAVR
jgi:Subtilase family